MENTPNQGHELFLDLENNTNRNHFIQDTKISLIIIYQIFLLVCDWSKRIMWPNIPQQKLGNIQN